MPEGLYSSVLPCEECKKEWDGGKEPFAPTGAIDIFVEQHMGLQSYEQSISIDEDIRATRSMFGKVEAKHCVHIGDITQESCCGRIQYHCNHPDPSSTINGSITTLSLCSKCKEFTTDDPVQQQNPQTDP